MLAGSEFLIWSLSFLGLTGSHGGYWRSEALTASHWSQAPCVEEEKNQVVITVRLQGSSRVTKNKEVMDRMIQMEHLECVLLGMFVQ